MAEQSPFTLLFELLFSFHVDVMERYFSSSGRLVGTWHQLMVAVDPSGDRRLRRGEVVIERSGAASALRFLGHNFPDDGSPPKSKWNSTQVSVRGREVVLAYASQGAGRPGTNGVMHLHIYGRPAARMLGEFSDCYPSTTSGSIELFKSAEQMQKRIEEIKTQGSKFPAA